MEVLKEEVAIHVKVATKVPMEKAEVKDSATKVIGKAEVDYYKENGQRSSCHVKEEDKFQ